MLFHLLSFAVSVLGDCAPVWGSSNSFYDGLLQNELPISSNRRVAVDSTVFSNIRGMKSNGSAVYIYSDQAELDIRRSAFFNVSSVGWGGAVYGVSKTNYLYSTCFIGCTAYKCFAFSFSSSIFTQIDQIHCSHSYKSGQDSSINTYILNSHSKFQRSNLTHNSEAIWGTAAYFRMPLSCTFSYNAVNNNTGRNIIEFFVPSESRGSSCHAFCSYNNIAHNRGCVSSLIRLNTNVTYEGNIHIDNDLPAFICSEPQKVIIRNNVFSQEIEPLAVWYDNQVDFHVAPFTYHYLHGGNSYCFYSCTNVFTIMNTIKLHHAAFVLSHLMC